MGVVRGVGEWARSLGLPVAAKVAPLLSRPATSPGGRCRRRFAADELSSGLFTTTTTATDAPAYDLFGDFSAAAADTADPYASYSGAAAFVGGAVLAPTDWRSALQPVNPLTLLTPDLLPISNLNPTHLPVSNHIQARLPCEVAPPIHLLLFW